VTAELTEDSMVDSMVDWMVADWNPIQQLDKFLQNGS
jgi:hypothetical protein